MSVGLPMRLSTIMAGPSRSRSHRRSSWNCRPAGDELKRAAIQKMFFELSRRAANPPDNRVRFALIAEEACVAGSA